MEKDDIFCGSGIIWADEKKMSEQENNEPLPATASARRRTTGQLGEGRSAVRAQQTACGNFAERAKSAGQEKTHEGRDASDLPGECNPELTDLLQAANRPRPHVSAAWLPALLTPKISACM